MPLGWYHLPIWCYWYFLPAILIPGCDSSSLAFCMMHTAYKLNKRGDNIVLTWFISNFEPFCCPMSGSNHCFLTCIQVSQEAGEMVWSSHLFKNFPQLVVTYTVKYFSIVSEARYLFLGFFFCLFYDPMNVGNLISMFVMLRRELDFWGFRDVSPG